MKQTFFSLFAAAMLITASCTPEKIQVEGITVTPSSAELKCGDSLQLQALVTPDNADDKTVVWSSSDNSIATVGQNGMVTGLTAGETVITAEASGKSATCSITVMAITAESITLNETEVTVEKGETFQLLAEILPENTQDKTITWSSSDTETASVDENGLITGIAKGDAVITASIADIKAECMIHVTETLTAANVGDWYYSDGTWSTELDPSKTPVALVFWAGDPTAHDAALKNDHPDCTHGLAVALSGDEPYMFWPLYAGYGMMLDDYRLEKGMDLESTQGGTALEDNINKILGYNNTLVIETFNSDPANSKWPVETMTKLSEYRTSVPAPESSSNWYIPSIKELSLLCTGIYDENINDITWDHYGEQLVDNRDFLNTVLNAVPEAQKLQAEYYNSSTEITIGQIYQLNFYDGNCMWGYNDWSNGQRNRFVLAF